MSRYETIVWGDGSLWGATTGSGLAWGIEIDWDGDGNFSGANEADRLLSISTFRGKRAYLNLGEGGFADIETGSMQITLSNTDGRYDAWNVASPLYPNVTDGKDVRVRVCDLSTNVIKPVFFGVIANIQASSYGSDPTVVLQVEDGWRTLRRTSARVALNQNIRPDVAIGLILDAAKWPARWSRSLDISSDNLRYFWSSGSRVSASEIDSLAQSFLGYFFVDASGKARFVTRTNIADAVMDLNQDALLKDIYVTQPWENKRNITRIKVHPLTSAAGVTLWQLVGSVPAIVSGKPLTLWANYSYNGNQVPGLNVITPVPTTDWTANTSSSGGGTDKTSQVSLSFSNLGDTAKLVFTYNGGGTIYLTSAKIRGDAIYELNATDVTYPADASTVANPREFLLDLAWQQDVNAALDFAAILGPFLEIAHPFPQVKIDSRPDIQFSVDLYDPVSASIPKIGIDGLSFRISGINHQSQGNCQRIITTFWLEPYIASGTYWTWPVTNFGVDTIFGW